MYDLFDLPEIKFPADFFWGSSTAGHQIEGDNIHSQNWAVEVAENWPEKSGKACNSYAMFKDDANLLGELEHQYYRFSIEWCRIEPEEGTWDQEAVDHYLEQLRLLKSKGIKTLVTLVHFTVPNWFYKMNGFEKWGDSIKYFERYLKRIVPIINDYVDGWNILNEPFSYTAGAESINFTRLKAHARGYHIVKSLSSAPVSSAHAFNQRYPYRRYDELDNIMTSLAHFRATGFLHHAIRTGELIGPHIDAEEFPEAKNAMDFWSVNFYSRNIVDSRKANLSGARFPHKEIRDFEMNKEIYPEGFTSILELMKDRPVTITENGCAVNDDRFRMVYIIMMLTALKEAIDRGVKVNGYIHWSLLDNYEWHSFKQRFGLVAVDYKTFKRTPKPSAYLYRDIIRHNGFNQDIIRKYLKEMPSAVFQNK